MPELYESAGVMLERVEVTDPLGTIDYIYPVDRAKIDHIRLAVELSSSHATGDIVPLDADPDRFPAQGSYFMSSTPKPPEFCRLVGKEIDPRFPSILDAVLADPRKEDILKRIGDTLAAGNNVVNAVPHGSLKDIGMLHGIMVLGLAELDYDVRSGTIISQGVTGLGKKFAGELVPLTNALGYASNKVWYVTPRTKNAENSRYANEVPAELIDQQNRVNRADIVTEQRVGGMVITAAMSGTSFVPDGDHLRVLPPNLSTLRLFAHSNTFVAVVSGDIDGREDFVYEISPELRQLSGTDEELVRQGDELMQEMTDGLNIDDSETFVYDRALS
ncbi:MAG: hypothetical protein ACHQT9_00775 [Candidatus Saccharimonadales bacterium]